MPDGNFLHSESTFFAIKPDPVTGASILAMGRQLARDQGLPGRLFELETLHVTICTAGKSKSLRKPVERALACAGNFVSSRIIDVVLDRAMGFNVATQGYPSVLLANEASTADLASLRRAIMVGQLHEGLVVPNSSFKPHVTLSRANTLWAFQGEIRPIRWRATELLLIHSHHDGQRRRHDVMERWPLLDI